MTLIETELHNVKLIWSAFGSRIKVSLAILLGLFLAKLLVEIALYAPGVAPITF